MNAPDNGADAGHAAGAAEGHDAPGQTRLRQLADEQIALRRLATLVARGEPPEAVFAAATSEALRYFGGGTAWMIRYELDGTATLLANEGTTGPHVRVGERWEGYPPTGLTATVRRTGQAARVDDYRDVQGRGAVSPGGAAVRGRADETRRRIERDLHDGTQQRLVSLGLELRLAQGMVPAELAGLETEIGRVADELNGVVEDLREIARGIHPAILSEGGLGPALRTLVAAYYVCSEALTNATRHAPACTCRSATTARAAPIRPAAPA